MTVTAPPNPGLYRLNFQMVREIPGQYAVFFGDTRADRQVTVVQLPSPPADKKNLVSREIFNTGVFQHSLQEYRRRWINTTGQALKLKKVYLWTGVTRTAVADIGAYITRISDSSPVQYFQWDHYQEPTAPNHGVIQDFGDNCMTLGPGDGLELRYLSNTIFGDVAYSQHVVLIWIEYP